MKTLMLTAAAVVSFAGFASEASAEHRPGREDIGRRIAGAVLHEVLVGGHHHGGGSYGPGYGGPIASHAHYHVAYHMHGTKRLHFHSHSAAHRYEEYLESLGLHVKLIHNAGHYDVIYHMHGSKSRTFTSHAAAHAFEERLERLGIHAKVTHH